MRFLIKKASIADAVLGAPLGALAAALAAKEKDRTNAATRGLLLGSLVGFIQGQRAVAARIADPEGTEAVLSPAIVSLLAGIGTGLYYRRGDLPLRLPILTRKENKE